MSDSFKYDVIISHGAKDKRAVRGLADQLQRDGLRVWLAENQLKPFQRAATKKKDIEQALLESRVLVVCLSRRVTTMELAAMERQTARFRELAHLQRGLVALRLDGHDVPITFQTFYGLDWPPRSQQQYARFLAACRSVTIAAQPDTDAARAVTEEPVIFEHRGRVWSTSLSGDGSIALSGSSDWIVRAWELPSGRALGVMEGHTSGVFGVALSGDGRLALSASNDQTVMVWDVESNECVHVLKGHSDAVVGVAMSRNREVAVSGSWDKTVRVWDLVSGGSLGVLKGHTDKVFGVALSADERLALSGSNDKTVRLWGVPGGKCLAVLQGHTDKVFAVALSADGRFGLSGSDDKTVRVWELTSGRCLGVLEGHNSKVTAVAISSDGRLALSGAYDRTMRVWEVATGRCIGLLKGFAGAVLGVAFTADGHHAFSSDEHGFARLWSLKVLEAAAASAPSSEPRYTNAKVVLIGDSGVGKTGLALRLCEDRWEATESTHGMTVSQLKLGTETNDSDIEREVWLWDFAGQPDYRLIHQLYIDEAALGLVVFDPQDDNAFDALGHWNKALCAAARVKGMAASKLLVAARCDRGGITVSRKRFEEFCSQHGFVGLWLTGAKIGEGCDELKTAIARYIPWDHLPYISTTRLFKSLKDALLKLKEEDMPLVRLPELRKRLELMLPGEAISAQSLRTVLGLMQGQGVVKILDFGDFVLLQPEQINRYASVVVRMAREHADEMGVVPERQVLDGRLEFKDMTRLSEADEKILLPAMVQTFLDRALCLREVVAAGTMLVFPSYFRRDKPEVPDHPNVFVSYSFGGPLDEIYATLVVKLSYSEGFRKEQLWKDAADFSTPAGRRVGLAMRKKPEGTAEMVVYFEPGVPEDTKVTFIKYVHEHLLARAQDVTRVRTYICPYCDTPLENRKAIEVRLRNGFKDIVCAACEKRVVLLDLIEEKFASDEFLMRVRDMDEKARINLDNESRELILIGHTYATTGEAGQVYRQYTNSDHGIDGEIEFKDRMGRASGIRLYLQLKHGDSYLYKRKSDGVEVFAIKKERWAEYWQQQAYPVMLVIRTSDGRIRWMDVTDYLKRHSSGRKQVKQIIFEGEPFTAPDLLKMRDRLIPPSS